jgi:NAD(P)-dependent dehydrogenase (short-subunit alcohol dehydrogenase family)
VTARINRGVVVATAFITGSNRGLGLEFVRQLAKAGWNIVATCRSPEKAEGLPKVSKEFPGKIEVYGLDISKSDAIAALAKKLADRPIDLLLCNAGLNPVPAKLAKITGSTGGRIQDFDDATWFQVFLVNLIGPLRVAAAFSENVVRSDRRIVAFISTRITNIEENTDGARYMYRTSKAALNVAIRNLSLELGPQNVICLALHPGWVRTDMGGSNADVSAEESVSGLIRTILRAAPPDNGKFFDYKGDRLKF